MSPVCRSAISCRAAPASRSPASSLTALALIVTSFLDIKFGWPAAIGGTATALAVLLTERASPWPVIRHVSWSVIPLVAGLFVLVRAIEGTGLIDSVTQELVALVQHSQAQAAAVAGGIVAVHPI